MATRFGSTSLRVDEVIVGGGARHLVIVTGMDAAHAQAFALAGPVDGERVEAAPGELEAGEEDAHLLRVIHAVDDDHGRAPGR